MIEFIENKENLGGNVPKDMGPPQTIPQKKRERKRRSLSSSEDLWYEKIEE